MSCLKNSFVQILKFEFRTLKIRHHNLSLVQWKYYHCAYNILFLYYNNLFLKSSKTYKAKFKNKWYIRHSNISKYYLLYFSNCQVSYTIILVNLHIYMDQHIWLYYIWKQTIDIWTDFLVQIYQKQKGCLRIKSISIYHLYFWF